MTVTVAGGGQLAMADCPGVAGAVDGVVGREVAAIDADGVDRGVGSGDGDTLGIEVGRSGGVANGGEVGPEEGDAVDTGDAVGPLPDDPGATEHAATSQAAARHQTRTDANPR